MRLEKFVKTISKFIYKVHHCVIKIFLIHRVDLNCDPDHVVAGACGAGREAECPEISWEQILCCPIPVFYLGHCSTHGTYHGQDNSCLKHGKLVSF